MSPSLCWTLIFVGHWITLTEVPSSGLVWWEFWSSPVLSEQPSVFFTKSSHPHNQVKGEHEHPDHYSIYTPGVFSL